MNTFLIIFSLAAILAGGLFSLERQLQMLQQNSYFAKRYFGWLKGAFSFKTVVSIAFAAAEVLLSAFELYIPLALVSAVSLLRIPAALKGRKNSIKPLVFTKRVNRMYFTAAALGMILGVLAFFADNFIAWAVFAAYANILPLACFATLFLTKPAEIIISNRFVKDAEKRLSDMPQLKTIGVTGSFGKTSVKYILGRMLNEKYNTLITPENFNTPMGIVRTVREKLEPQHEIFVAEMGAKKVGDIKELCEIAKPDTGIITSVGYQHLDTFGSIENIISTKFELADYVSAAGGTMFLNTDNDYIREKSAEYKFISYGTRGDADYTAQNIKYDRNGLKFEILKCSDGTVIPIHSKLLGEHNALNITGAAAVASEFGVSAKEITSAAASLKAPPHRLELKSYVGGSLLIDDAYNSNPSGCLSAARVLGSFEGMKRIIVTPGLVELGEKEEECNRRLGEEAAKNADIIIFVGKKRSRPLIEGVKKTDFDQSNLYVAESFKDATQIFMPMCDKNTVVMFENDLPDNYLE